MYGRILGDGHRTWIIVVIKISLMSPVRWIFLFYVSKIKSKKNLMWKLFFTAGGQLIKRTNLSAFPCHILLNSASVASKMVIEVKHRGERNERNI